MYKTIYVPVDNSDHSNQAISVAVELGKAFESKMVGCHVYAAKMHDYRFKQMEFSLPEEYLEENELERQRKIHDSLITMGLRLITDSYLQGIKELCEREQLPFQARMIDGKNHTEITRDLAGSDCDLVVMGALGLGRQRDSQIGSVCERVTRASTKDVWIVRHLPEKDESERDTILVGIDGSPQAFGALKTALSLAKAFDKKVEIIGVYDPYLHYSVFHSLVDTLTEKASKVFRFEEQNQLHEEVIDTGLAQIYQSHLDVAAQMAAAEGVEVKKTLLDGKVFQKILDHERKTKPWLLILGRFGVHGDPDDRIMGSNTENILRLCECDLLLTTGVAYPKLDVQAEESIRWTEQAEERMTRVPDLVKGIARTAILRLAIEKGHSMITSSLLDEAIARFMPNHADLTDLAEAVAVDQFSDRAGVAMCKTCGRPSSQKQPVVCAVCGGNEFEVLSAAAVKQWVESEGGAEEETTYDGKKLRWTQDARRALSRIGDAYQKRRTKARIQKSARMRKLDTVTLEFARKLIEEETGVPVSPGKQSVPGTTSPEPPRPDGKHLVARDKDNNPLFSAFAWNDAASERLLRVPAGFMRDRTQTGIEELAREQGKSTIDLELVEAGLELGRQRMREMLLAATAPEGKEPASSPHAASAAAPDSSSGRCPALEKQVRAEAVENSMNEVGTMAELAALRKRFKTESPLPSQE